MYLGIFCISNQLSDMLSIVSVGTDVYCVVSRVLRISYNRYHQRAVLDSTAYFVSLSHL